MSKRTGKIIAGILCGVWMYGQQAICAKKLSLCPTNQSSTNKNNYSITERIGWFTAPGEVVSMVLYRYAQGRYIHGERPKKPIIVKTLLDALRVTNDALSLWNNL
ncbi:MAG: hypothetical protein V1855_02545, partial [bacterium]